MTNGLKIAIAGKGGVGKTSIAGALSLLYAKKGKRVLAVDADPDSNLASALGLPRAEAQKITPLSAMKDLIEDRTGAKSGFGGFFSMNPRVDDIPERLSIKHEGVRLLVLGGVKEAGSGCICPESVLLKSLVRHLVLQRDDVIIIDMEAGIEHLGRATAQGVNLFIIVIEPGQKSINTAHRIRELAASLGIPLIGAVANKVTGEAELSIINDLVGLPLIGHINYNDELRISDLKDMPASQAAPSFMEEVAELMIKIDRFCEAVDAKLALHKHKMGIGKREKDE